MKKINHGGSKQSVETFECECWYVDVYRYVIYPFSNWGGIHEIESFFLIFYILYIQGILTSH